MITVLQGESIISAQINDLSTLGLPALWENKIKQVINENKMLYEPWIESAKDFEDLKQRLKGRGFTGLPMGLNTILDTPAYGNAPKADTSSCRIKRTMMRKQRT